MYRKKLMSKNPEKPTCAWVLQAFTINRYKNSSLQQRQCKSGHQPLGSKLTEQSDKYPSGDWLSAISSLIC
jgi:hypothetical protein